MWITYSRVKLFLEICASIDVWSDRFSFRFRLEIPVSFLYSDKQLWYIVVEDTF